MVAAAGAKRGVYELPVSAGRPEGAGEVRRRQAGGLPEGLLSRNVLWFCRLRWLVIGLLVVLGGLSWVPGLLPRLGLLPHRVWPFVAAGVLAGANLLYLAHARRLVRQGAERGASGNLWAQIVTDLVVLTVVVHFVGSLETYVAFAYLFHIVLACIFFSRGWSLVVTAIACGLYVGCVTLEETGLVPPGGLYANRLLRQEMDQLPAVRALNVGWAMATWIVVWYLGSHLSDRLRERDRELAETNRRLVATQEERRQHMLQTTHELKAPFSAIHANVQLLAKGHCGPLPEEARDVVRRIGARCRRLATEIQEMLQLANLHSTAQEPPTAVALDLADALEWCIDQVQPLAQERQVQLRTELQPVTVRAAEDHVKMLLVNLLGNAVAYSHARGRVSVTAGRDEGDGAIVTIEDEGIGISSEKLASIFEPYYRANEAVRHNKESTGLGLAIVRQVAETHGLRLRVESEPGVGTRFTVGFPAADPPPTPHNLLKEDRHGLRDDRG